MGRIGRLQKNRKCLLLMIDILKMFKGKVIDLIVMLLFLFSCLSVSAKANSTFPRNKEIFLLNKGTIYEYGDDTIPKVCFFPIDEARWDGSKITPKEWIMLTDFQKAAFLTECVAQVEEKYNITLELNGWEYLISLNRFVNKCNNCICENPPMCEAIEKMLIGDGKVLTK